MKTGFGIKLYTLCLSLEVVLEAWIVLTNAPDVLFYYREIFVSVLFNSVAQWGYCHS